MKKRLMVLCSSFLARNLEYVFCAVFFSAIVASADNSFIIGRIIWQGHDLSKASVSVFKDGELKEIYTKAILHDPDGVYAVEIEDPGNYYLAAFVDSNSNNILDTGDGMGIYGVMDWQNFAQKPDAVEVGSGQKILDINIEITASVGAAGNMVPLSGNITTGISGKIIWQLHKDFSNGIVFVYTDPSWNNRVAQAKVSKTGEYVISVPPGQYYVLAVIDENNTNLLDSGDYFGIWGMTRFGAFPRPVKVDEGKIIINRNILIVARIGSSGKPIPSENTDQITKAGSKEKTIKGRIIWPNHELKNTQIQVYSDPSMAVAIARTKADEKGNFQLLIPEGEYFITASVDLDGDGKYTKGDGLGAYGSPDASSKLPVKFAVNNDSNDEIDILITAEFDNSGQLKAIDYQNEKENQTSQDSFTGMSGKIVWEEMKLTDVVLVLSKDQNFENGISVPIKLENDSRYLCSTPSGTYYIMALADLNDNDAIDTGDGIGFYGAGYLGMGYWGDYQKVCLIEGRITPYINIKITAYLGDDGKPIQTLSGIRSYYGDPDTIIDDAEKNTQEWWYWSRGFAFTFEKEIDKPGWSLIDTYEFEPKSSTSDNVDERKNGLIYYTSDRNIWAISPDGNSRKWISYGDSITGMYNGSRMLFLDSNRSFCFINTDDSTITELNWRNNGFQPALSSDGKVVAFIRNEDNRNSLYIRSLETGDETRIPDNSMDIYHPSWSYDNELIAFAASEPSISDDNINRDIYYYDLISKRIEQVTDSSQDELSPVWSTEGQKSIVFCRAGEIPQLWIANFDENGKPYERQLTKYGGSNPAWSPDGKKVIYENNAQLWTINPDGSKEEPMLVNNEPVFGLDPFWTK